METILITGGSGVLGSALLDELRDYRIVCTAHRRRVTPRPGCEWIDGDVSQRRLGLDGATFRELARRVDAIVHCAAMTEFNSSPELVYGLNVAGTRHVLELAAAAQAPLYYVSTAFVAREHLAPRADSGSGLYISSKRQAEQCVRTSGLPAAIIRPSVVIGHSVTGAMARFQGLHSLTGAVVRNALPIVPLPLDACIDFLPQDTVAGAIADLVRERRAAGEWWLTAGPAAVSVPQIIDRCLEVAGELGSDPFRPRVIAPDVIDRLMRPVFIDTLPPRIRESFEEMLEMTSLFAGEEPFPCSLSPEWRASTAEQLAEALARSIRFWAAAKRLDRRLPKQRQAAAVVRDAAS